MSVPLRRIALLAVTGVSLYLVAPALLDTFCPGNGCATSGPERWRVLLARGLSTAGLRVLGRASMLRSALPSCSAIGRPRRPSHGRRTCEIDPAGLATAAVVVGGG